MRRVLVTLTTVVVCAFVAAPALADAGAPGTTFPEQPGSHTQKGCAAVSTNPGTSAGGAANPSPTAAAIQAGLFTDACVGG